MKVATDEDDFRKLHKQTIVRLDAQVGELRAEIAALKKQQCAAWTESGKCETVEALRAENARLKTLLGRRDPVRCATCGGIRERAEIVCGECGERLEKEGADEAK